MPPARKTPRPLRPDRPERIRAAALEVLGLVLEEEQLADRALARVLRRERALWSSERRAVAEAVYGLLKREAPLRAALDRALAAAGERALRTLPARDAHAALLAAELALSGAKADAGGLSAQLRRAVANVAVSFAETVREARAAAPVAGLALEHSMPEWVAAALTEEIGDVEAAALLAALNARAPLTLRANTLRATRDEVIAAIRAGAEASGAGAAPTRYSPWGLTLSGNPNLFGLPAFKAGLFEVQDEGSQLLALMCRARPGQKVVDACAGGGGKALALAAEMHNRGELWALDVNERRLGELKTRARRAGAHNIRSAAIPAEGPFPAVVAKLEAQADVVLVDAPCTGIGALRRNPDARRRLTEAYAVEHADRQLAILRRMSALVRPGGLLVYATCSVLRREDEAVVEAFLATDAPFAPVSPQELLGAELAGALDDAVREGPPGLRSKDALRVWPHRHGTDGFFAAGLRRAKV